MKNIFWIFPALSRDAREIFIAKRYCEINIEIVFLKQREICIFSIFIIFKWMELVVYGPAEKKKRRPTRNKKGRLIKIN